METDMKKGPAAEDNAARVPEDRETASAAKEKIDLRKLVIYSEIMSPKFRE